MVTLFIIRGLPGSGKSTLGEILAGKLSFAADDYFMEGDEYKFDPSKLSLAHAQCLRRVRETLELGRAGVMAKHEDGVRVAVCNTFSKEWEWRPYVEMAKELGVRYYVLNLFDNDTSLETLFERNVHGVPRRVFTAMYDRWEH
jgi:adenylylsulfate kinase-like enzyme